MNRLLLLAASAVLASVGIAIFTTHADSQPQAKGLVVLQPSSPGSAQIGNANLTGTIKASQFEGGGANLSGVNADLLDGIDSSAFLQSVPLPLTLNGVHNSHIILGQNSSNFTGSAAVIGTVTSLEGNTTGVFGQSASVTGIGVHGKAGSPTGATIGVHGSSASTSGLGMFGYASSPTGVTYGVLGQSNSKDGFGVYGLNTGTTFPSYAGYFQSSSGTGISVKGASVGGQFESNLVGGSAIQAVQTATTGFGDGGNFETRAVNGTGVVGYASSPEGNFGGGIGVYGRSNGYTGIGVYGYADFTDGQPKGVMGQVAGDTGWALFAAGRFAATGTKNFRIDHPLDPLNKFLLHYCSEGPEPMNAYSGNVTTDAKGYGRVELPDYYSEINRDERIQLTVLDEADSDSFVQAKVVGLVHAGAFRIRTSAPRTKVFWRLEAVRNDAWVKRYGAPVEQEKVGDERGKYQHPELYGAPREMGMFDRRPAFGGDVENH